MNDMVHVQVTQGVDHLSQDVTDQRFGKVSMISAQLGDEITQGTSRAVLLEEKSLPSIIRYLSMTLILP